MDTQMDLLVVLITLKSLTLGAFILKWFHNLMLYCFGAEPLVLFSDR